MLIISPNLTKVYILAVDRRNKYNSQEKMLIYIESLEIMGGGGGGGGRRGRGTKTLKKKENENKEEEEAAEEEVGREEMMIFI